MQNKATTGISTIHLNGYNGNKQRNKQTKPKTDMPNKVRSNWNSHTTGVGEIGTTTMENYLAAKLFGSYLAATIWQPLRKLNRYMYV